MDAQKDLKYALHCYFTFSWSLLTLKKKIGLQWHVNWALSKKLSRWIGQGQILLRCGPNNSNEMYLHHNPNIFKTERYGFQVAKLVQKEAQNNISDQNPSCWTMLNKHNQVNPDCLTQPTTIIDEYIWSLHPLPS